MSEIESEIASQPACWEEATALAAEVQGELPARALSVAVIGCGTSWFVGQAYAWLRREGKVGPTEAFAASEFSPGDHDQIVAISRSGTTSEVLRAIESNLKRSDVVAITASADTPIERSADRTIRLGFADERSIVQTRFATSALALLRAHLGEDLSSVIAQGDEALAAPMPPTAGIDHVVFLGHGWSNAIANEAALKLRETAQVHTESHPAMEYRHGPISLAEPSSLVWILGSPDPSLADDVRSTGARVIVSRRDPMAELVLIQRTGAAIADSRGLDPDHPRHLGRSVVLR